MLETEKVNRLLNVTFIVLIIISGYLCGACYQPKGVSALLNKCVTCGNENLLLIIAIGQ